MPSFSKLPSVAHPRSQRRFDESLDKHCVRVGTRRSGQTRVLIVVVQRRIVSVHSGLHDEALQCQRKREWRNLVADRDVLEQQLGSGSRGDLSRSLDEGHVLPVLG